MDHAIEIIEHSFVQATATRRTPHLKNGQILKIILFGSYARGDWVHDPVERYFSDFDLLVVVDHEDLTDNDFWEEAESRLLEELSASILRTPVSLIVHSLQDVNWKLEHGRSFFIDIIRDGIVLKDTPALAFSEPQPLPPATALEEAEAYFEDWKQNEGGFARLAAFALQSGDLKHAAFLLHQAAEAIYMGFLLVHTLYTPKSHNLVQLRNDRADGDRSSNGLATRNQVPEAVFRAPSRRLCEGALLSSLLHHRRGTGLADRKDWRVARDRAGLL